MSHIDGHMFVEEMLFILGHRDVENVDAFVREMDKKAEMLDGIEGMGIVRIYDNKHWTTDYNILKEKAEKWDYWLLHDPYAVNTLLNMREMSDKLEAVKTMVGGLVDHWRDSDNDLKEYYVDAYRSVQENITKILEGEP